jgi:hypothetical protein
MGGPEHQGLIFGNYRTLKDSDDRLYRRDQQT